MAHHVLGAPLVTEKKIGFEFFFWKKCSKYDRKFEIFFQKFITPMKMNKVLDMNKV